MQKKGLDENLKKIIKISKEYGAEKIIVFGSSIEDIENANDIDIAVKGINPRFFFIFYGKISKMIDEQVDIIDLNDIREHLYQRIVSKGKVIYAK